jgi:hypothetical protein
VNKCLIRTVVGWSLKKSSARPMTVSVFFPLEAAFPARTFKDWEYQLSREIDLQSETRTDCHWLVCRADLKFHEVRHWVIAFGTRCYHSVRGEYRNGVMEERTVRLIAP